MLCVLSRLFRLFRFIHRPSGCKVFLVASVAISLVSTSAFAVTIEKKKPKVRPTSPVLETAKSLQAVPVRNWTGFYAGVNSGYSNTGLSTVSANEAFGPISGFNGGGQIGYDFQSGRAVFGLVADADVSDAGKSYSSNLKFSEPYAASLRLKGGYLLDNDTLVYLTGGYSVNSQKIDLGTYGTDTQLLNGYVVGGGIERFFAPNISAFMESRYSSYNSSSYTFSTGSIPLDYYQTEVRVGLNYHFGPAVEVAKTEVATPVRNWTGFYAGGNSGYSAGVSTVSANNAFGPISGFNGGGQIGYDFQSGRAVFGLVADADVSDAGKSYSSGIKFSEPYAASLRLKGGYLLDNDTLVYLTGGYSVNSQKLDGGTIGTDTQLLNGYVVGGGIERFFAPNISAFMENRYSSYNSSVYTFSTGSIPLDYSQNEVRVGVNYHF